MSGTPQRRGCEYRLYKHASFDSGCHNVRRHFVKKAAKQKLDNSSVETCWYY